jgi:hypothetical protein
MCASPKMTLAPEASAVAPWLDAFKELPKRTSQGYPDNGQTQTALTDDPY